MTKRTIVTSALPYVNNVPHLGTLMPIISADVYSRFLRLCGEEVVFVCGTDEHGTTAEVRAIEEGITPRELVDKYFKIHKKLYTWFNCEFDCFGRTSSKENEKITIDIFKKLDKNGYIVEQDTEQTFCEGCDRFLADRFVEGICPYCSYEKARGDQCENCGKLLNAVELLNAKCKTCGKTPIVKGSKHLFIDLPKLEGDLKKWIKKAGSGWSANAITMTNAWLKEGLKQRCITRDLKWGIKVPGHKDKVFYSWFDAPIGYIGITAECKKNWKNIWTGDSNLVQFMGKDNIPFHTILFPAFLIGAKEKYVLVDRLSVNEYLNYEGGQFSKSRGIGVFADDALDSGVPADVWRYYLMINRPEKTDTEFSWDDFQAKLNNELVANIGNLINRIIIFIERFFNGEIPSCKEDKLFLGAVKKSEEKVIDCFEKIELKEALKEIMHICKLGNQYFQNNEPWKLAKEDKDACGEVLGNLANVVKDVAILISPFMPKVAEEINEQLGVKKIDFKSLGKLGLKGKVKKAKLLFEKIDDIEGFREKYSGKKSGKFPLNLKVAVVETVDEHPKADKLYVLSINLGDEERQIVAGLRKHYSKKELVGKKIVVVSNLKPAVLRGVESNGMLLAAEHKGKVGLLTVDKSAAGESVGIDGVDNNSSEVSYEEFEKLNLAVKKGRFVFEDKVLKAGNEFVKAEKVENGAVH